MVKRPRTTTVKKTTAKRAKTGDYQKGREFRYHPKQELKAFDTAYAITTIPLAGSVTVLNVQVQGTELYQRIARKTYMKSVHIRGFFTVNATSVQDAARLLVVYDANPAGAAPAMGDIIRDMNAGAALNAMSEINLNNRQRFKILRDHQILLPAVTYTAGVLTNLAYPQTDNQLNVSMFIKLGLETVYNAVNIGTIADINTGALFLCLISENNDSKWQFNWQSRLRYYD